MTSPDSPRRRRNLLVEAQRLTLEIDQIEDELDLFRARDLPAFQAWFTARPGPERAQIRELEAELAALTDQHNAILACARLHDQSLEDAYRTIAREERTYADANAATRARIERDRGRRRAFVGADLEREFRARTKTPAAPAPDPATLKVNFRKLARRLHPDLAPGDAGDPVETRWRRRYWALLQTARARGDVATLADLYQATRVRQLDLGEVTLEDAVRARAWLARERDDLASERGRARDTVAWQFTRANPAEVERRVRAELRRDVGALRAEIESLRQEHAALRRPGPTPRRARATRRPVTSVHQLSFFD